MLFAQYHMDLQWDAFVYVFPYIDAVHKCLHIVSVPLSALF